MGAEFKDKVVVVSGASRGIGRAIAVAFAGKGARTVLASSNAGNLAEAARTVAQVGGPQPLTVAGDLRTLAGCENLFTQVKERCGRCDILVNNAGATRAGNFIDLADDVWLDGFALKFFATVRLTRLFWPMLKDAQGRVVCIGGGAGRSPDAEFTIGASVNAAMASLAKGLSRLGMRDGVTVNVIHPGTTATERTAQLLSQRAQAQGKSIDDMRAAMLAKSGIRRMGKPEEVAALAMFLCSEWGSHIQGTAIAVDGGATPGVY
ncbi:MAG: SDR family oxidoreductase [Proteobacteria bacterium]|nr:SDR family oxidoreductase [Pseudomonadota bacterium]